MYHSTNGLTSVRGWGGGGGAGCASRRSVHSTRLSAPTFDRECGGGGVGGDLHRP